MSKSPGDLSFDELQRIGLEAGRAAFRDARAAGVPVVGLLEGALVRIESDGVVTKLEAEADAVCENAAGQPESVLA